LSAGSVVDSLHLSAFQDLAWPATKTGDTICPPLHLLTGALAILHALPTTEYKSPTWNHGTVSVSEVSRQPGGPDQFRRRPCRPSEVRFETEMWTSR
jgi:hypothetical protein